MISYQVINKSTKINNHIFPFFPTLPVRPIVAFVERALPYVAGI